MAKPKAILSWSSGKDSAWSLHVLRQRDEFEIVALLTTVNAVHDRVAMHAVRRQLLESQAVAAGIPLWTVDIPSPCTNEQYEAAMTHAVARAREAGVEVAAFGDLFLRDIRDYREKQLSGDGHPAGVSNLGIPTDTLAQQMIDGSLRARITCIDPRKLDQSFAGREFDSAFVRDLPAGIDPCGENGEFHSFAWSGPMFRNPVSVKSGEVVTRDGFVFADLLPAA